MKREWNPLLNTFEINTRGTHKKALILFTDTISKLQNEESDPQIQQILAVLYPLFIAYENAYQEKQLVLGEYEGKTMQFESILTELSTKIRQWEGKVRNEYIEDSYEEHSIFPNKRTPFVNGTYENRRSSVGVLATKLAKYPVFASLSNDVRLFYDQMTLVRKEQQILEGRSAQLSDILEHSRIDMCNGLYGALGLLMFMHNKMPSDIARYFDLSLLRKTTKSNENNENEEDNIEFKTIEAGQTLSLGARPMDTMLIYLKNTGNADLHFSCSDFQGVMDSVTYTLSAGNSFMDSFKQLFLAEKKYLMVKNAGTTSAVLEMEFLDE